MLRVPGAEHEDERDDQDVERERDDDVDEPARDRVDRAAVVAGEQAERRADHEREEHGEERDAQVGARAVDEPRPDVAAELVGAEPVRRRRARRACAGGPAGSGRAVVTSGAQAPRAARSARGSRRPATKLGVRYQRRRKPRRCSTSVASTTISAAARHQSNRTRGSRSACDDVGEQVDEHDQHREHERHRLHDREVALEDRVDHQLADARQGEDLLDRRACRRRGSRC